ncbi:MAG: thioredoxin family protein [Eubacteriales bacterium]|nr:thioredoxin family protein [Eubacteriales bacterium]
MKPIMLFILHNCPYCRQALAYLEQLKGENSAYAQLPIRTIDEGKQSELANQYDYYYVPTFYVDGVKKHEGAVTKEQVKTVLDAAL